MSIRVKNELPQALIASKIIPAEVEWRRFFKDHFKWQKQGDLRIDPRYQRTPSGTTVRHITSEPFEYWLAGILLVSERPDESLWLIDGGSRNTGLGCLGYDPDERVPTLTILVTGGTEEDWLQQEARMFTLANGYRCQVPGFIQFVSALVAKDPWAVQINEAVVSRGLQLVGEKNREDTKCIRAVSSLKTAWGQGGGLVRVQALLSASGTLCGGDRHLIEDLSNARGILKTLVHISNWKRATPEEVWAKLASSRYIDLEAKIQKNARDSQLERPEAFVHSVRQLYNRKVESSKRWFEADEETGKGRR